MREAALASLTLLEAELRSDLTDPGICRAQNVAEGCIADVSIDRSVRVELRVVEDVEHLQPKLQRARFGEAGHLVQRHIVVVDARPVEHPAPGVALRAERIRGEGRSVEVRLAVPRV